MFVADFKDDTERVSGRHKADPHSPPSQKSPSPNPLLENSASACLFLQSLGREFEMPANRAQSQFRTTMSPVKTNSSSGCTFLFFGDFLSEKNIKPICLGLLEGQEDCLYINVYRPEPDEGEEENGDEPKELLPVSCHLQKDTINTYETTYCSV